MRTHLWVAAAAGPRLGWALWASDGSSSQGMATMFVWLWAPTGTAHVCATCWRLLLEPLAAGEFSTRMACGLQELLNQQQTLLSCQLMLGQWLYVADRGPAQPYWHLLPELLLLGCRCLRCHWQH